VFGRLYVFGGATTSVEFFDAYGEVWRDAAAMRVARKNAAVAV
jgi:hypothetical protein